MAASQLVNFNDRFSSISGNASSEAVIKHYLDLHTNVVSVQPDGLVEPRIEKASNVKKQLRDAVMLNAANNLMLASYRNQLMHVYVNVALVSLSVNGCSYTSETVPVGNWLYMAF